MNVRNLKKPVNITNSINSTNAITAVAQPSKETIEHLTRQVAKGSAIAFGGSIIGKMANLGLHILLGRVLGPSTYGLYVLGTSVIGIAQSICSLGLGQGVIRFCAMYRGEGDNARVKGTIISALAISLLSSILVAIILFTLSSAIAQKFFHEPELTWVLRVFALALPFYVLLGITTSFAQSFWRIEVQQGVLNIFKPLINLVLVGLAFLLGFRLAGAVCGFIASGILSAGLGFYFLYKIFPEIIFLSGATYQIALLRVSIPMFLASISYVLLTCTDRIMLGYFGKASDVGIYNAASIITLQMTIFLSSSISIFSPIVSDLYNKKANKELEVLFKTTTKWTFSLSIPLFVVFVIFSRSIVLIFGPRFIIGAHVLIILTFAQLINISTGPVGMLLRMTGRQDLDFFNGLILIIVNIGLNIWLIPIYGIIGAAIATTLSLILIHIARLLEVYTIFKMLPYNKHYIKPIIAGVITILAALIFNILFNVTQWEFLILIICFLTVIFIMALWFMGLDSEDKVVLSAVKNRILLTF